MNEDTIQIIRIETGEAVKSVNELRENVKILKERLGDLKIGSTEYQDTLEKLKQNQAAVKDAMYATSSSMEEVAANAKGINVVFDEQNKLINQENQSYNALVNTMAELKARWRATSDEMTRANLGEQINQINDELKRMDASVGNFSRSVGDYTNSVKSALRDFPKFADPAKNAIKTLNDTTSLLAGNPIMGVIALITPLVVRLTDSVKENEESMGAINKIMIAMKPVMDFFQGVLGKVVEFLTSIISKVGDFLGTSGFFSKLVEGIAGVGNAIISNIIAPFKGVIAAIKVFQEQGIKGIGNAAKAFGQEMKSGFAFRANFNAGREAVNGIIAGINDKKKDVTDAGKEVVKSLHDGIEQELDKMIQDLDKELDKDIAKVLKDEENTNKIANTLAQKRLADIDKAAKHQLELNEILVDNERERAERAYEIQLSANERRLAALEQFSQEALDRGDTDAYLEYLQEVADLEVEIETNALKERKRRRDLDAKDMIVSMKAVAESTSSILGSIADMYEADEKNSERNANKIKGLRIASATIDTISGAIGAFMGAVKEIPGPLGIITGGVQAAAVTAAGIAQIAKIKNTKVSGSASVQTPTAPAVATPPSLTMDIPQVRSVTSASEEERLNQMASDQRVVLVMSDLEVKQGQSRVQVAEASF